MDAIVESPIETIHQSLDIQALARIGKASEDDAPFVGEPIAICILEVNNVRGGSNEDATIVADDRCRPGKVLRKNGALLESAVSIGIFEQPHASKPLIAPLGVIAH